MHIKEASHPPPNSSSQIQMYVDVADAKFWISRTIRCDYTCSWWVQHLGNDSFYLPGRIISVSLSGDSPRIEEYKHRVDLRETVWLSEFTKKAEDRVSIGNTVNGGITAEKCTTQMWHSGGILYLAPPASEGERSWAFLSMPKHGLSSAWVTWTQGRVSLSIYLEVNLAPKRVRSGFFDLGYTFLVMSPSIDPILAPLQPRFP